MASFTATFSYMSVVCDGLECNAVIQGRYFACLDCSIPGGPNSFDLCISCYLNRNYSHFHTTFEEKHLSSFPAVNYRLAAYATVPQSATLIYNNEAAMKGEKSVKTGTGMAHLTSDVNDVCCSIM
ncbi:uncharacterized protein LOC126790496 [Argentina anserina]|uniref:uncharacterized protein LOC126790496 n=1 Tax=Argentina anserina TaxID=57926 RepID=UPI0021762740|nr:uncharacterized protein LOC126790496 [Potentilla anserina]